MASFQTVRSKLQAALDETKAMATVPADVQTSILVALDEVAGALGMTATFATTRARLVDALNEAFALPGAREAIVGTCVGYGRNATGGKGGVSRVVTNLNDSGAGSLRAACETPGAAWITFAVSGTIALATVISITSNKTIDGRGADITIATSGIEIGTWDHGVTGPVTNIIVENIKFKGTTSNGQLMVCENASDVWIDHCTFQDAVDEEIYVGSGSSLMGTHIAPVGITISWCHFPAATNLTTFANKAFLVSDKSDTVDAATTITSHHNHFQTQVREPLLLWATLHGFNNYYHRTEIGVQIRHHGKFLSENEIFEAPYANAYPMVKVDGYAPAGQLAADSVKVVAPLLLNGATVEQINPSGIFTPGYPYTLEASTAALQASIVSGAGWQNVAAPIAANNVAAKLQSAIDECDAASGGVTPPADTAGKYRDNQKYLFQRVRAIFERERFPGGTDYPFEYWPRQTSPGLVAPSGHGWFGGGVKGGPTKNDVCPETEWAWDRVGGDVLSLVASGNYTNTIRNPATLIPWHVSPSIGTVVGQQTIAMQVTQLLQFVQTNDRWCALLLRKQTGALRAISTRFAGNPPTPPTLDLNYADGEAVTLPCWVIVSNGDIYSRQTHPTPPTECFIEFERPTKPVAAATLRFTVVGGSALATYGVFPLDPPRNTEPFEAGIADAAPLDAALAADSSIIDVQQFPDTLTPAQLMAKYVNNAITNQLPADEANYDPVLWNPAATPNLSKLPHTVRNQWLFADNSKDAIVEVVDSHHTDAGFYPVAPGVGAMKITRLPLAGFGNGVATSSIDDGHNLGMHLLLPEKYWGCAHFFMRACYFIGEPEDETIADKINYTKITGTTRNGHWVDQGGKIFAMPYCSSFYGSGFSGTSGGPSGFQLRGAWTSSGIVDDEGPLTRGISIGLHSYDYMHGPPGFPFGKGNMRFGQKGGRGGMMYSRRWYSLEVEAKLNDVRDASGNIIGPLPANNGLGGFLPNGEYRAWIDGVKVIEATGLVYRTLPMGYGFYDDPTTSDSSKNWLYNQSNPASINDPGYIPGRTRPSRDLGINKILFNYYHGGLSPNAMKRVLYVTALAYGTKYIGPLKVAA